MVPFVGEGEWVIDFHPAEGVNDFLEDSHVDHCIVVNRYVKKLADLLDGLLRATDGVGGVNFNVVSTVVSVDADQGIPGDTSHSDPLRLRVDGKELDGVGVTTFVSPVEGPNVGSHGEDGNGFPLLKLLADFAVTTTEYAGGHLMNLVVLVQAPRGDKDNEEPDQPLHPLRCVVVVLFRHWWRRWSAASVLLAWLMMVMEEPFIMVSIFVDFLF